jgi:hypothetical protein
MKKAVMFFLPAAAVILLVAGSSARGSEESGVRTSSGRLMIWGTLQAWYQQVQADPGRQEHGVERFQTRRMHLGFAGSPAGSVDYAITIALDPEGVINSGVNEVLSMGVYEAWIGGRPTDWLTLRAGSLLPPWTMTMPRPVSEHRFIRYPLIVDSGQPLFTPWRQTGLLIMLNPGEQFLFNLGLWNGLDRANEFHDDNNMKDTMISASFEAYPGIRFYMGYWGGKTEFREVTLQPGESAELPFGLSTLNAGAAPVTVGGGVVEHTSTWTGFETERANWYLAAEALWHRSTRDGARMRDSQGFQVSTGYTLDRLQGLVRYELFEPDTNDAGAGADDEMEWTTLGLNFDLTPNSRLMADYIFKSERLDNQRANDELILQISLAF